MQWLAIENLKPLDGTFFVVEHGTTALLSKRSESVFSHASTMRVGFVFRPPLVIASEGLLTKFALDWRPVYAPKTINSHE